MSLKNNQFYLIEEDGRSNYVNNGIVTSRGTRTPLPEAPAGWQDIAFAWERNKQRHGTLRGFSNDLDFVLDGAEIVRDAYYKTNLDRKIYLLIQRLKLQYGPSSYKWLYETLYKGELDLTTVKDFQTSDKVTVSIMEGGLHKQINANWSTVYRIEFDQDAVNVKMDGIELQEAAKYNVPDGVNIQKTVYGTSFYLPASFINREGNLPYLAFLSQSLKTAPAVFADKLTDSNYLVKAADNNTGQLSVTITGRLKFSCTDNDPNNGFKVRFLRSGQTTVNQDDYLIFSLTPTVVNYEYDVDLTIPLDPGERLYLEGIYFGTSGTEVAIEFNPGSDLKLTYEQRGAQTWVKGFLRKHLFRKLMKKITGNEEVAISELLEDGDRIITSFDAIRGIEGAGIQTSLADFYTDVDADLCAGFGIINGAATANLPPGHRATLEARESFYNGSDTVDLGEAKEFEVGTPAEMLISKIKVGWKEPQTEDVNGKFGFNASQQYTTPMQRTSNEYLAVSPYKADPFEIETTRIALNGKDSTDSQKDNDNAVLWVERSQDDLTASVTFFATGNKVKLSDDIEFVVGQKIRFTGSTANDREAFVTAVDLVPSLNLQIIELDATLTDEGPVSVLIEWVEGITYNLKRESYTNEADPDGFGVPSPTTVFNIDLSPKRMLLRHGRWLASILDKYKNEKLIFQSGTRNTALKTVQGSVTIAENSNVNISDLGEKIFQPYLFFVTVNGDNDLPELMEVNPNRCFSCTLAGKTVKGYNMKAAYSLNELNEQVFSLLCTGDTDVKKLV